MQGVLSARAEITSGFSESFRSGIVTLPKIRNPKLEIRNKPEGPKSESQNPAASRRFEPWNFRILNLFRISGFGFVGPQMAVGPVLEFRPKAGLFFCTDTKRPKTECLEFRLQAVLKAEDR